VFAFSIRQLGMAVGLVLAGVTVYTSLFGIFDPGYQRPLTFAACIVAAVCVKPMVSIYPLPQRGARFLLWVLDALLVAMILLAIQRFVSYADGMQNMLVDYSRLDQLIALGGLIALIELTRREFGLGLSLFAAVTLVYCLFGEMLPGGLRRTAEAVILHEATLGESPGASEAYAAGSPGRRAAAGALVIVACDLLRAFYDKEFGRS